MRPCRLVDFQQWASVGGLSAALNRMHLLGILLDRLRAMREPHPVDVTCRHGCARVASADGTPARAGAGGEAYA